MGNVTISPMRVLLTSGQAATFEAKNADGQPLQVSWSISPSVGQFVPPPLDANAQKSSATFTAPPQISSEQTVAIIASTANDSASATISLVRDSVSMVPANVHLEVGQSQQFAALATGVPSTGSVGAPASDPASVVSWILSPTTGLGAIDQTGLYKAPDVLAEAATVIVTAARKDDLTKQASSTINLVPAAWTGKGLNVLGLYLLVVFSLVFLLIALWPPSLPSADTAKAERLEAEKTLASVIQQPANGSTSHSEQAPSTNEVPTTPTKTPNPATSNKQPVDAKTPLQAAQADLTNKQTTENQVADAYVDVSLKNHINRDVDLILLVLLGGALGSFLHIGRSYSEFVGNRQLKASWTWWYVLGPFIGAGLALVFYAALRGGFLALSGGAGAKASGLSVYAVVSLAALVGMFSKAATSKLGEVFDTLFKSDKAKDAKDPLTRTPAQNSTKPSPDGAPSAGSPDGTGAADR